MRIVEYLNKVVKEHQSYDYYNRPEWDENGEEIDYRDMDNPLPKTIASADNMAIWDYYIDVAFEYPMDHNLDKKYNSMQMIDIEDIIATEVKLDPLHMETLERVGSQRKEPIIVAKFRNNYICEDGNHRLAHLYMRGEKRAYVLLHDYDQAVEGGVIEI